MRKQYDTGSLQSLATFVIAGLMPGSFSTALMMDDRARAYEAAHPTLKPHEFNQEDIVANMLEFVHQHFPRNLLGDVDAIRAWKKHGGMLGADEYAKTQMRLQCGRDAWFMQVIRNGYVDFVWGVSSIEGPTLSVESIWKDRNPFLTT